MVEKAHEPAEVTAERPKSYLIRDLDSAGRCFIQTAANGTLTIKEISEEHYNVLREHIAKERGTHENT